MKMVFIAGPFRGANGWEIEENIRKAERIALEVWKLGAVALCPHTNSRNFHGTLPDGVFIRGTQEMLKRCDAMFVLPDSEASVGTQDEIKLAESLGIPVFEELSILSVWLSSEDLS